MFDEVDYASLFLADDPLLGAGFPVKSRHHLSHLPSSAAVGGGSDDAGFALFPFHLPPSAPSPSAGSSSAQSDSVDSSSRSAPSPSAVSVHSATGAEATLLAAPGGVDDLFGGGLAGYDLDGDGGVDSYSTGARWTGDFGSWGTSASTGQIPDGAAPSGPSAPAFAPSPSAGSNTSKATDVAYGQQQQFEPFFDGLDLDLSGFTLPPLPDDLAALGAPTSNGTFRPSPSTDSLEQTMLHQQSQAGGAIPSFVLSHIENNQAFHSTATASAAALPGPLTGALTAGQGLPPSTVSPTPNSAPASAPLKRKASSSGGSATSPSAATSSAQKPVSDHNAIERKYRDNINDAHVKLRDSVPVLRVLFNTTTPITAALDTPSPSTGLIDGQMPETKQGKATVLTAAREYIFLLQQSRAAERRFSAWLEDRIGDRGLRGEWEVEDETSELEDVYLRALRHGTLWRSFPHYADQDEDGNGGPKRKKARSGAPVKSKAGGAGKGKGSPPVGAKEAGKVMLALGLGLGVGLPLTGSSAAVSAFDVSADEAEDGPGAVRNGGRIIGRTLLRRSLASTNSIPTWSAESALSLLALLAAAWLAISVMRRLVGVVSSSRAAKRAARIENALLSAGVGSFSACDTPAADNDNASSSALEQGLTLKQALGVDTSFAVARKLVGTMAPFRWLRRQAPSPSEDGDRERWAWVWLAEQSLTIPTDLSSYLLLSFVSRRLAEMVRSGDSSTSSGPSRPDQHILLAFLSHALTGAPAQPSAAAVKHWSTAQAAAAATVASNSDAEDEVLKLSFVETCAICPEIFSPSALGRLTGAKARIGDALVLRDLKALWADVLGALAPRSTRPQSSAASSPTSSTITTPHDAGHPFGHLVTNPLAPAHRVSLALELNALERAASPGSAARELVVVSRAIWAVMERDAAGLESGVLRVLGGEKSRGRQQLGQASQALLAFAGVKATGAEMAPAASSAAVSSPSSTDLLISEVNLTLAFILGYFASVALLSVPPLSALTPNKPLLQATLRARALLHQLDTLAATASGDDLGCDSDEDEGDEGARERFGAVLYSIGRWAVGWKDEREEDDSGFEDGF